MGGSLQWKQGEGVLTHQQIAPDYAGKDRVALDVLRPAL